MFSKVFYVKYMLTGYSAITIATIIFVRRDKAGDRALLEHERTHVRQFRDNRLTFWIRYLCSKKSRFAYEAEAYRVQLDWVEPEKYEACRQLFAKWLVDKYQLGISLDEALKALSA